MIPGAEWAASAKPVPSVTARAKEGQKPRGLLGHARAAAALADPTLGAAQLSLLGSAPHRRRLGSKGAESSGVPPARSPPRRLLGTVPPAEPHAPSRPAARMTCGRPGREAEAGRAKGRPRRPLHPHPTGPPRSGAGEWGGVRISLSLRHRPRSWRRRSGRYRGPSWGVAGRRGNSTPGKALSRFSVRSGKGAAGGSGPRKGERPELLRAAGQAL